jgi:pSer/pThr/pTyr-binding forkhead associated (FHA) protein
VTPERTFIEDLDSKNGTYVNGEKVDRPRALSDGDVIRMGSARMVLRLFCPPPSTETEAGRPEN